MERYNINSNRIVEVPKVDMFLNDIVMVCKKHGMSIAHEDAHGAFIITDYDESNIDWLQGAFYRVG